VCTETIRKDSYKQEIKTGFGSIVQKIGFKIFCGWLFGWMGGWM
jgi:hypothetical protein